MTARNPLGALLAPAARQQVGFPSCAPSAPADSCWSAPRCWQLPFVLGWVPTRGRRARHRIEGSPLVRPGRTARPGRSDSSTGCAVPAAGQPSPLQAGRRRALDATGAARAGPGRTRLPDAGELGVHGPRHPLPARRGGTGTWLGQHAGDHTTVREWPTPDASPLFDLGRDRPSATVWLRLENKPAPLSPRVALLSADGPRHKRAWTHLPLGGYLGFGLLVLFPGSGHARL